MHTCHQPYLAVGRSASPWRAGVIQGEQRTRLNIDSKTCDCDILEEITMAPTWPPLAAQV
jgi:hypothetical protein